MALQVVGPLYRLGADFQFRRWGGSPISVDRDTKLRLIRAYGRASFVEQPEDPSDFTRWPLGGTVRAVGTGDIERYPTLGLVRNVGCRVPVNQLTVWNGDFTLGTSVCPTTGSKSDVKNLDIKGRLLGRGDPSYYIRDVRIQNRPWGMDSGTVTPSSFGTNYDYGGIRIEYYSIDVRGNPNPASGGMDGGGYTADYGEIMGTIDGIGWMAGPSATLRRFRISDGFYVAFSKGSQGNIWTTVPANVDPRLGYPIGYPFVSTQGSGDQHGDCIQIQGGASDGGTYVISDGYLGGSRHADQTRTFLNPTVPADADIILARDADGDYRNACLMLNSVGGRPIVKLDAKYMTFEGSQAMVNQGSGDYSQALVTDSRWRRKDLAGNTNTASLIAPAQYRGTGSRNVYDDTNQPI